jgi:hypothetical protein
MTATFAKFDNLNNNTRKGEVIVLNEETGVWDKNTLAIQVICGGTVIHTTTDPEDAYWQADSNGSHTKIGGEFVTEALGKKRPMTQESFYKWILKAKGRELRNKGEDMYLAHASGQMGWAEYEMRGGY